MIESRWWALAYANNQGSIGTLDIQIQDSEKFPVTPKFWENMTNYIQQQKNGVLIALTPVSGPFGGILKAAPQ